MMLVAGVIFFGALLGISSLLLLKRWEFTHDRRLFPGFRLATDERALQIKSFLIEGTSNLEALIPFSLRLLQRAVRAGAIAFGHLAHWLGRRSHELADLVSHKYRFERRETRSEFLKKVIEHPIRNIPRSNGAGPMRNTPHSSDIRSVESLPSSSPPSQHPIRVDSEVVEATPLEIPASVLEAQQEQISIQETQTRLTRSISRAKKIPAMVGATLDTAVKKVRHRKRSSKTTKHEEDTAQSVTLESEA